MGRGDVGSVIGRAGISITAVAYVLRLGHTAELFEDRQACTHGWMVYSRG
jgi:predicted RNA-binding protein YlqC (UPF0109 family)